MWWQIFSPLSLSPLSRKIGQKYFNSSTIYFDRICNTTLNCVVLMRFTYCASHLAWQWSAVCAHTQDSSVNLNLISSDGCLCLVPMFVFFFFFCPIFVLLLYPIAIYPFCFFPAFIYIARAGPTSVWQTRPRSSRPHFTVPCMFGNNLGRSTSCARLMFPICGPKRPNF